MPAFNQTPVWGGHLLLVGVFMTWSGAKLPKALPEAIKVIRLPAEDNRSAVLS
jgi:hypothetical protein